VLAILLRLAGQAEVVAQRTGQGEPEALLRSSNASLGGRVLGHERPSEYPAETGAIGVQALLAQRDTGGTG